MQHHFPILRYGSYDLRDNLNSIENENSEEDFQIEDFYISSNQQLIAIVSYYELRNEYLIEVIDILNNKKLLDQEWLFCNFTRSVFCQFSFDSKYLVYHANKTLYILDLISFQKRSFQRIDQIYTLNNKNQIFLYKQGNINIYSIEENSFRKIYQKKQYEGLRDIQTNFFLRFKGLQVVIFFLKYKFKIDLFQFHVGKWIAGCKQITGNSYIDGSYVTENKLLIIQFQPIDQILLNNCIQLRNLQNGRLLRYIISNNNHRLNLVQDNQHFFVSEAIDMDAQLFNRFNLILGLAKQMIFKIPQHQGEDQIYITSKIVVNIQDNIQSMRYFVFDGI